MTAVDPGRPGWLVASLAMVAAGMAVVVVAIGVDGAGSGLVVVGALLVIAGAVGTGVAGVARQQVAWERSGAGEDPAVRAALTRALRSGRPPADPALHEPLRRLLADPHGHGKLLWLLVPILSLLGILRLFEALADGGALRWTLAAFQLGAAALVAVMQVVAARRRSRLQAALAGEAPATGGGPR